MSKRSLLTGISLSLCGLIAAGAATAAPRSAANPHCIIKALPSGAPLSVFKNQEPECFPTFSDAVFAATGGRIHLSQKEPFAKQLDTLAVELKAKQAELIEAGTVIVTIDYQNINYGGVSAIGYSSGPCSYAQSAYFPSFVSNWNDFISSTRGFAYCDQNILWENNNFGGASITCWPDCPGLSAMNDRASSQELHAVCTGTAGQWNGCRGTGCHVCSELVASYPCYFQNHPKCVSNGTCDGQYFTCNKDCPAPTLADQC